MRKEVKQNVISLYESNFRNIPNTLRKIADMIDGGWLNIDDAIFVTSTNMENGEFEVNTFGMGKADQYKHYVILDIAKTCVIDTEE